MKKIDGVMAMVLCAFLWSTGGILIKFINASSFAIAGLRSLIALCVFCIVLKRPPIFRVRNPRRAVDTAGTFYLWAAAIGYSSTMILYCIANKLTTAANTILLQYTNPVYIILFSPLLLGEKNSKSDYFTALGVLGGIVLFFIGDIEGGNMLGNILAALSGVTFGFTTIFMRKSQLRATSYIISTHANDAERRMRKQRSGSANSFMIAHLITAIIGIPFCFFKTNGVYGAPQDWVSVIALLAIGVFQMAFATLLYSRGIGKVTALSAGIITMIEPLMNPIWVMIFAHEIPSLTCVLGGVIILGCIILREVIGHFSMKANEA